MCLFLHLGPIAAFHAQSDTGGNNAAKTPKGGNATLSTRRGSTLFGFLCPSVVVAQAGETTSTSVSGHTMCNSLKQLAMHCHSAIHCLPELASLQVALTQTLHKVAFTPASVGKLNKTLLICPSPPWKLMRLLAAVDQQVVTSALQAVYLRSL